jgi:hypothetical protein
MNKTATILILLFSMLMPLCFASQVVVEDFESGWTPGFAYGEFVAHKFTCLGDTDCSPAGTLGAGGVQIVDETVGPKYLRLYSTYDSVNSNTKTALLYWNISSYNNAYFYNKSEYGFAFNMRVSDIQEVYSDLYNKFMFSFLKSGAADLKFNNMPYLTSPSNTYGAFVSNWDFESHNVNDYPYTFTGMSTNYANAIDEATTSIFETHGKCYMEEDIWSTIYIRFQVNISSPDTKTLQSQQIYINGEKCWDVNITAAKQVDVLAVTSKINGARLYAQNQAIDIDNLRFFHYEALNDPQIGFDIVNNSVIVEPGSPYNPAESDDDTSLANWFSNYGLIFALLITSIMIVAGAKFGGVIGGCIMALFSIIVFAIMGWIPMWVVLLIIVATALAFAYFMSGIFQGGN